MPLSAGSQLGPYEIQSALAESGTGDVYRARDTRLNRTVAIKVLPPHWNGHPDAEQRVEVLAKIIAELQHPNIRALHDSGKERPRRAGDATAKEPEVSFLVLEHLEGETVADRLARAAGPAGSKKRPAFAVDEALAIAMQMAGALDKAHHRGLVHGGVRPGTVFLTHGGTSSAPPVAKLLDLGLVEPAGLAPDGGSVQLSMLPTQAATQSPVFAVEYLAPEQLEGRQADARTDLFSLGVVLYEMLTGRKAFEGRSPPVLMAAIMTADPDPLPAAQPLAPPALDHVLKRCLAKDPEDRWQTAHDLLIQLRWINGSSAAAGDPAVVTAQRRRWWMNAALATAVVMLAALAAPLARYVRGPGAQEPFQYRSLVVGLIPSEASVSPDGRLLAFMARPDQQEPASLYVRMVGSLDSRRVDGTDDAAQLFWSPDSRYIGFVAGGKLKKVAEAGGPPEELGDVQGFAGGTWNEAGTIVFGTPKGLFSVSDEGGKPPVPLTAVDTTETGHFWPRFLPDGRHYVYLAWSSEPGNRALFTGALDSKVRTRLMPAETNVAYARSSGPGHAAGYLLFHREATLLARPFDADSRSFTGDPVQMADGIGYDPTNGRGYFEVSQENVLVYLQPRLGGRPGLGAINVQLGWVDRGGRELGHIGDRWPGQQGDFDLSRDGRLIAVSRVEEEDGADIWIIDADVPGNARPLTEDPGDDFGPVWSPDGNHVAYTSLRKGNADIYVKNANGLGDEVALLETPANEFVEDWSEQYVAYLMGSDNSRDIYALPLVGDKKPIPVVTGRYDKNEPQFSRDGKWMAYTSTETGRFEVYVVSFPPKDQKVKVSLDGGGQPRWRGTELYFRALDGAIMVADIAFGAKLAVRHRRVLFPPPHRSGQALDARNHQLATIDGQRFLLRVPGGGRGRPGGVPGAYLWFDVTTGRGGRSRGFGLGFARGRGPADTEAPRAGPGNLSLTVFRNWTAVAGAKAQ
jgi:Tol biopolymer transport system component